MRIADCGMRNAGDRASASVLKGQRDRRCFAALSMTGKNCGLRIAECRRSGVCERAEGTARSEMLRFAQHDGTRGSACWAHMRLEMLRFAQHDGVRESASWAHVGDKAGAASRTLPLRMTAEELRIADCGLRNQAIG